MKTIIIASVILLAIIVAGMYIVGTGVGVHFALPSASHCYNQLNAAGQVVGSFCQ